MFLDFHLDGKELNLSSFPIKFYLQMQKQSFRLFINFIVVHLNYMYFFTGSILLLMFKHNRHIVSNSFIKYSLPNLIICTILPFLFVNNACNLIQPKRYKFYLVCLIVFILILLEEKYSIFSFDNVFDYQDLLASIYGIFISTLLFEIWYYLHSCNRSHLGSDGHCKRLRRGIGRE